MRKRILAIVFLLILSFLLSRDNTSMDAIRFEMGRGFLVQHVGEEKQDVFTEHFVLNEGTYHFSVSYTASELGNTIIIKNNDEKIEEIPLDINGTEYIHTFSLEEPTSNLQISLGYVGSGYLEIRNVVLETEQPWYHDSWLRVAGIWSFVVCIWITRFLLQKMPEKKQTILDIWIVMGIAVFASILFLSGNRVGDGDDLIYHLIRIEGIADGLRSGQFPVMIYPNQMQQNGYLNAMYPSIFLYFPAGLRILGVSLATSYKVFLLVINFATALAMYYAMKNMEVSRMAALIAVLLYVFMRYRLNNMLVRAALGETLAMIFLPLIIAGLYQVIIGNREKWWLLVIGATGVIQSHILSTAIYAVIALVLVICFAKKIIFEKRYVEIGKAILFTVLLNVGFLVPFLLYYMKGNLNLDALEIASFEMHSLSPAYILGVLDYTKEELLRGRDYSLRYPLVCMLGAAIVYVVLNDKKKNLRKSFVSCLLCLSGVLLYMSSNWFPLEELKEWEIINKIFENLQFPWRLIGPAAGMIVVTGAISITEWKVWKSYQNYILLALAVMMLADTSTWDLKWQDSITGQESVQSDIYAQTITKDKVCMDITKCPAEYVVKGNMAYSNTYQLSADDIEVLDYAKDDLQIDMTYQAESTQEQQYIDLPLIHYMGYRAVDENKKELSIQTSESGTIRIDAEVDGEEHTIHIRYRHPWLFRVSELISMFTLLWSVILGAKYVRRKKNG